jgi:superfamily II DNA helicase RecQ
MALTATATPAVQADICKSLLLLHPVISCTGFDRSHVTAGASYYIVALGLL